MGEDQTTESDSPFTDGLPDPNGTTTPTESSLPIKTPYPTKTPVTTATPKPTATSKPTSTPIPTITPLPATGSGEGPKGIYVVDDGDADFSKALAQSFVAGALVRVGWEKIETTDDSFDFTLLCNKITTAHNLGKKVSLVNYVKAPSWLVSQLPADQIWNSPLFGNQPLPWNELALTEMAEFIKAEANSTCGGYALKNHPALAQIDTPVLGIQSIRQVPSNYNLATLIDSILYSIDVWHKEFAGTINHNFYTGLFPLGSSVNDAVSIRDAILQYFPDFNFFQETWTGSGPSGNLALPLDPNVSNRKFSVMLQACGYWSNTTRIKCSFATSDTPQYAFDNVAADFNTKYLEIYPDDLLFPDYQDDWAYISGKIK